MRHCPHRARPPSAAVLKTSKPSGCSPRRSSGQAAGRDVGRATSFLLLLSCYCAIAVRIVEPAWLTGAVTRIEYRPPWRSPCSRSLPPVPVAVPCEHPSCCSVPPAQLGRVTATVLPSQDATTMVPGFPTVQPPSVIAIALTPPRCVPRAA
jgi:hypothetical protein